MIQSMIAILDLGSTENPRIAREIRELGVYSEIYPHDITPEELKALLERHFTQVECYGVEGNAKVMEYYEANRRSVERIARWDILNLQHRLPAWCLRLPYDVLNRLNRRRLLKKNRELTSSIAMDDYRIAEVSERSFDLFFVARK